MTIWGTLNSRPRRPRRGHQGDQPQGAALDQGEDHALPSPEKVAPVSRTVRPVTVQALTTEEGHERLKGGDAGLHRTRQEEQGGAPEDQDGEGDDEQEFGRNAEGHDASVTLQEAQHHRPHEEGLDGVGSEVRLARHLEHHGQEDHAHQEVQELQPASPKDEARPAQVGPHGRLGTAAGPAGLETAQGREQVQGEHGRPSPGRVAAPLASPPATKLSSAGPPPRPATPRAAPRAGAAGPALPGSALQSEEEPISVHPRGGSSHRGRVLSPLLVPLAGNVGTASVPGGLPGPLSRSDVRPLSRDMRARTTTAGRLLVLLDESHRW